MKGNTHGGKQLGKAKKQLVVFVSKDLHDQLRNSAAGKELTISDLTRIAIKDYLAKENS